MNRQELINSLREALLQFTTDEKSMCRVAAERGIFCRGFRSLSDEELRARYWWLDRKRPDSSRAEIETLADSWQLAQQDVQGAATSCDVQQAVHDTCGGWDDFSDEELAGFYKQLTGRALNV
jgi:hypothetical protein